MDRPDGLSDPMWNVCLGTWNFDPAKRPPFYKVRKQLEEIVEAGLRKSPTENWKYSSKLVQNARIMTRQDSKISILGYQHSGFDPNK